MSVIVRKCTVAEIEGNAAFPALAGEYAEESRITGLPTPDEKIATYRMIDKSQFFQGYGAFQGDVLIGFLAVLTPVIPHYGVALTVAESIFVGKQHRKTGAGLKLIRAAETHARDMKSPGVFFSAPVGGSLARILPRVGYRETNRVFFRELRHV